MNDDRLGLIESISAQISFGALNAALSVCEALEMPLDDEFVDEGENYGMEGLSLESGESRVAQVEVEVDQEAPGLQRGGVDSAFDVDADADDGGSDGCDTHAHTRASAPHEQPGHGHGAAYSPLQTNSSTHQHTHTAASSSSSSSSSSSLFMGRFAMLDCLSQSAGSSVYAARDESSSVTNQRQGPAMGSGQEQGTQRRGQGQSHVVLKFITDEEAFNSETQLRHGTSYRWHASLWYPIHAYSLTYSPLYRLGCRLHPSPRTWNTKTQTSVSADSTWCGCRASTGQTATMTSA